MGFMIIDGRKVEFTDEKNILTVIRKQALTYRHCVTIQNFLLLVRADSVR